MKHCFLVSKEFGLFILKTISDHTSGSLIIHPDDKKDKRSVMNLYSRYAKSVNSKFVVSSSNNHIEEIIKDYSPDIVLVCGWYTLFSKELLKIPKIGFFGIHHSLLPKYRGGSPLVWSIIKGEKYIGSTVFKLEKRLDSGLIAMQIKIINNLNLNIQGILEIIKNKYKKSFPKVWNDIILGNANLRQQKNHKGTFFKQRLPKDGKIDWKWNALKIHNFVKAQSLPYPGAFTFLKNKKIIIEKTKLTKYRITGTPGEILKIIRNGSILVACGNQDSILILLIRKKGLLDKFSSLQIKSFYKRLN